MLNPGLGMISGLRVYGLRLGEAFLGPSYEGCIPLVLNFGTVLPLGTLSLS